MKTINVVANKEGNEYVGIELIKEQVTLHMPIGYYEKDYPQKTFSLEELKNIETFENIKEDFKTIIKLLCKKIKIDGTENNLEADMDIITAIKIIENYIQYGLYKQTERKQRLNDKGRINWSKTIHQPQCYSNHKIIYTNIVNEYMDYQCEKEIQKIQEYCLYEIAKTIGFLFNFSYPKTITEMHKKEMINRLQMELKNINEDNKKEIVENLLVFLKNTNFDAIQNGHILIRYKEFEFVFETLIDVCGIKDKASYYPKSIYRYWKNGNDFRKPDPSRPDTIIEQDDVLFLLDAKYKKIGNLPNEYDIFKQIRYEEWLAKKKKSKKIINAFLLPNHLESGRVKIEKFYATSVDKEDKKIYVVYVDMKNLIVEPEKTMTEVCAKLLENQSQSI